MKVTALASDRSIWVLPRIAVPLAILLFLALRGSAALAQSPEIAYVTSEATGEIVGVDTSTYAILQQIEVGNRPHNMDATTDGLLVVATFGSDAVTVVDPVAETFYQIEIGAPPHDVTVGEDGRTVLAVSEDGLLAQLDPATGQVLDRTELTGRPHNVDQWRDTIWITDITSERMIVVDADGIHDIPISIESHSLAVRPGTTEMWVTAWSSDRTIIIDLNTREEVAGFQVGTSTYKHLAFTADGAQVWITESQTGSLFVFDAETRQLLDWIDLEGRANHVGFAGGRAYVVVGHRDMVVLDMATRDIIGRVDVGAAVHDLVLLKR